METTTAQLVSPAPPLFYEVRLAIAGFLARYSGNTRSGYTSDPSGVAGLVRPGQPGGVAVRRAHIELYARCLEEEQHLARATIGRRLSTVVGFYRFAVVDGYLPESPAEHVRRPKIDTESTTLGLDRMELGAFIAQAGAAGPVDHALACLSACWACEYWSLRHRHRAPQDRARLSDGDGAGQGARLAVIPLPPRVARALDLAAGERLSGPVLLSRSGRGPTATPATSPPPSWPGRPERTTGSTLTITPASP